MLDAFDEDLFFRQATKRTHFDLHKSFVKMCEALNVLPNDGEAFKMISPAGGWSSCVLLMWLAEQCEIESIHITSLRVGKKELAELCKIKNSHGCSVEISMCMIAKENKASGKDYAYSQHIESVCEYEGIDLVYAKNHSKIILVKSKCGFYVIETSSNFNENPKVEQFSLENSKKLFYFYLENLRKLGVFRSGKKEEGRG